MRILPVFIRKMHAGMIQHISLTPAQLFILMMLEGRRSCRLVDISREMAISPPAVSGIIDRLERDGYVQRVRDEQDRRVVNLLLTKRGTKFLNDMRKTKYERTRLVLGRLSPEDRENHIRILKILLEEIDHV